MFRQTQPSAAKPAPSLRALVILLCFALTLLLPGLPALHAAGLAQVQDDSEVTRHSIITTIAGNGVAGGSGDNGPATRATLNTPASLAIDAAGNVFVADAFNHRIRKISPSGDITTLVGTGEAGADGDGGPAADARLRLPLGVAVDSAGTLYIADTYNHRIRKVTSEGIISTIAGTGVSGFSGDGGPGAAALLASPTGIAVASDGTLYIADTRNHRVRKLTVDGTITTVAGTGAAGYNGDGGPATLARLNNPRGVTVSADGKLYIVDRENRRIRMVDADGLISTIAGTGSSGFNGDRGQATQATLRAPYGIAVDPQGNLFIADTFNHRVRKVTPDGSISTVAGSDQFGFSGDGWAAGFATLHYPLGLAVDIAGNLYVADSFNHRIRKVWTSADTAPTPNLFL
ncbi:MAG: NHL repeat-containing protein [Chloroflexi bacterium]|nr:NHL repeat-containing protein [Chloroflexota bacterium]